MIKTDGKNTALATSETSLFDGCLNTYFPMQQVMLRNIRVQVATGSVFNIYFRVPIHITCFIRTNQLKAWGVNIMGLKSVKEK